jgi:hypothetical protein
MTLFPRWLKFLTVGVCLLGAGLAWALPSPKDIESAVQAGQYTQAEAMLREVLQDKPQSAKAHYELGQVLAHLQRYKEAQSQLLTAKDIDPALKFAASPEKFNGVLSKVNELAKAPSTSVVMEPAVSSGTQVAAKTVQEAIPSATSPLTFVWIAIAALLALGLWLRRSAATNTNTAARTPMPTAMGTPMSTPMGNPAAPRGFGAQFTPNAQPGYAGVPQGYAAQPTNSGGSTMTGAVVGGLAGVAAGYALSKAMEGDHHTAAPAAGAPAASNNSGYVPFDTPAQADLGSFDAGSGSDWDNADGGGGSDDW